MGDLIIAEQSWTLGRDFNAVLGLDELLKFINHGAGPRANYPLLCRNIIIGCASDVSALHVYDSDGLIVR